MVILLRDHTYRHCKKEVLEKEPLCVPGRAIRAGVRTPCSRHRQFMSAVLSTGIPLCAWPHIRTMLHEDCILPEADVQMAHMQSRVHMKYVQMLFIKMLCVCTPDRLLYACVQMHLPDCVVWGKPPGPWGLKILCVFVVARSHRARPMVVSASHCVCRFRHRSLRDSATIPASNALRSSTALFDTHPLGHCPPQQGIRTTWLVVRARTRQRYLP